MQIRVLSILALACTIFPSDVQADCGYDNVTVAGSASEVSDACVGLKAVMGYFSSIGFSVTPRFRLTFPDRVFIDVYDPVSKRKSGRLQVSGYYDAGTRTIEVTSGMSKSRYDRRPWGLRWGPAISNSILLHELTHLIVHEVLGERYGRMSKAWLEYLASAVQIELMPEALKMQILKRYAGTMAFELPEQVNLMVRDFDPDGFAIMAYLHANANGGRDFVRRILIGDVKFNTGEVFWFK